MGRVYCSVLTKRHRDELGLPRKPELSGNFTIMKCSSFVDYVIVRRVCKTIVFCHLFNCLNTSAGLVFHAGCLSHCAMNYQRFWF